MTKAIQHLSKDKKLKTLIDAIELNHEKNSLGVYADLIRSIASQQLSVKAAATIYQRFLDLFEDGYPHAELVLELQIEDLRAVGFSRQKSSYIQNIATYFMENKLMEVDWEQYSDEEIIEQLSTIKGVGKWTVQMILMFSLNRPDVFPVDDLGVVNGMKALYGLTTEKKELRKELIAIADNWKPYRTTASRYIWRYKDAGGIIG